MPATSVEPTTPHPPQALEPERRFLIPYAALGVTEVWRFDGRTLRVEQLQDDGTYATVASSPSLPMLPLAEVPRWATDPMGGEDRGEWEDRFRAWVRATLLPPDHGEQ